MKQSHSIIAKAANDLIRKELVPHYTTNYIKDNIRADAITRTKDKIQYLSCPVCGITLPSRFLMRQHIKIHGEAKDNEPKVYDIKPYFK